MFSHVPGTNGNVQRLLGCVGGRVKHSTIYQLEVDESKLTAVASLRRR